MIGAVILGTSSLPLSAPVRLWLSVVAYNWLTWVGDSLRSCAESHPTKRLLGNVLGGSRAVAFRVDFFRLNVSRTSDPERRWEPGQTR